MVFTDQAFLFFFFANLTDTRFVPEGQPLLHAIPVLREPSLLLLVSGLPSLVTSILSQLQLLGRTGRWQDT